jgi:hypothetical protein
MLKRQFDVVLVHAVFGLCAAFAGADEVTFTKHVAAQSTSDGFQWCHLVRRPVDFSQALVASERLAPLNESEPNNSAESAQILPLGDGTGQDVDLDIS